MDYIFNTILTQENLNFVFTAIIFPVLTALGAYAVLFIRKKGQALKLQTNNEQFKRYIDLAEDAIVRSVIAVNETFVNKLKEENQFTKETALKAFNAAKESALAIMDETAKNMLDSMMEDFDKWIDITIENIVAENKFVID